jgi:hypothetical protein
MCANGRFTDTRLTDDNGEAAVLRMDFDHIDRIPLLRQQGNVIAIERFFG